MWYPWVKYPWSPCASFLVWVMSDEKWRDLGTVARVEDCSSACHLQSLRLLYRWTSNEVYPLCWLRVCFFFLLFYWIVVWNTDILRGLGSSLCHLCFALPRPPHPLTHPMTRYVHPERWSSAVVPSQNFNFHFNSNRPIVSIDPVVSLRFPAESDESLALGMLSRLPKVPSAKYHNTAYMFVCIQRPLFLLYCITIIKKSLQQLSPCYFP